MPELVIRPASRAEIKEITAWFIAERSKDARFVNMTRGPWQRFMMRHWVMPRFLRAQANTLVLEQDGQAAGLAVIEQAGESVTLSEFTVNDGCEVDGLLLALASATEELARDREYRYARIAPLDSSESRLALFRSAGYQLVDYYLWCFVGETAGVRPDSEVRLRPIDPKAGVEQRIRYLRQELDASQVAGRAMIEDSLFPRRPSPHPSFSVELSSQDASGENLEIGYVSLRPNERQDAIASIAISLAPDYWGTPQETQAIGLAAWQHGAGQPVPVRVMISTSVHAGRCQMELAQLGLARRLDERPILFKDLQPQPA